MKYRVGDLLVLRDTTKIVITALITKEYESNGLRFELTFEDNQGKKNVCTYNYDELEHRFSKQFGWTHHRVVL